MSFSAKLRATASSPIITAPTRHQPSQLPHQRRRVVVILRGSIDSFGMSFKPDISVGGFLPAGFTTVEDTELSQAGPFYIDIYYRVLSILVSRCILVQSWPARSFYIMRSDSTVKYDEQLDAWSVLDVYLHCSTVKTFIRSSRIPPITIGNRSTPHYLYLLRKIPGKEYPI
ncbi:hypothetical protein BDZ94DRAFT_1233617 [Collybia nuda]|uniref:Uncharacterized protein n=1 Tax=Collybia nuda TaxID=64659 RepID=A0A9P6CNJ8_9AGAR|nr:hypothetical protein BDZ94DRAFT_1233617 [Collybia nuda]